MWVASGFRRIVVRSENSPECRNIGAGVEYGFPGQAKPAHVARVDLAKPQIDRISRCDIPPRCGGGIGSVAMTCWLSPAVDIEGEGIAAALGLNYG